MNTSDNNEVLRDPKSWLPKYISMDDPFTS